MKRLLVVVAVVAALGLAANPARAQHGGYGHGGSRQGHSRGPGHGGGQAYWGGHGRVSQGGDSHSGRHATYGHYGPSYAPAFPQFHVDYGPLHFNYAPARPAYRHVHAAPYYAAPHFDMGHVGHYD